MHDPLYGDRGFAAELAALDAAGLLVASADPEPPGGPAEFTEADWFDATGYAMSRVDAFEWQEWTGASQDEAERVLLAERGPAWVSLPPGGELAAALEFVRPQTESPMALIEVMKAATRLSSWAEALRLAAMASFDRQRAAQAADVPRRGEPDPQGRPVDPRRSRAAEIACALRLSPTTVHKHIDTALRLTSTLTATHSALRCGALTLSMAISIADATDRLTRDQARAVEAHVLTRAAHHTHANLRAALRRQVAKVDARNEANRHRRAISERLCRVVPLADGMAGLWVVHSADKIQQMYVVVRAMADLAKRDHRTATASATPSNHRTATASATSSGETPTGRHAAQPYPTVRPTNVPEDRRRRADGGGDGDGDGPRSVSGDSGRDSGGSARESGSSVQSSGDSGRASDGSVRRTGDSGRGGPHPQSSDSRCCEPHGESGDAGPLGTHPETGGSCRCEPHRDSRANDAGAGGDLGIDERRTGDGRTAEQRRADVVADLFEHLLRNGLDWLARRLPDQHRRRPHIEVTIPAGTLLGLDDGPCELTGYGPISAELGRSIAADGTWRRLLTDPVNGTVLEASTTRHDPGMLVSETLLARYPTCAWPGCNRRARECDRDHTTPFTRTGETSLAGLGVYCEYHHVIKDTPDWGWRSVKNPDQSITLTSPTGHRYTTAPPARGPLRAGQLARSDEAQPSSFGAAQPPSPGVAQPPPPGAAQPPPF